MKNAEFLYPMFLKIKQSLLFGIILLLTVVHLNGQTTSNNTSVDSKILVDSLNELAWITRNNNPKLSKKYAEQAYEIAERLVYKKGQSDSMMRLGVYFKNKGFYNEALDHYQRGLDIRLKLGQALDIASAYKNIANVHKRLKNTKEALEHYEKALDAVNQLEEHPSVKRQKASLYNSLGGLYHLMKNEESALELFSKSLDIRIELKDSSRIANSYNNLGNFFDSKKDYEKAIDFYSKSLELQIINKDSIGIAKSYSNLGNVYFHQKRFLEAIHNYDKSIAIQQTVNNVYDLAGTYQNKGMALLDMNEFEQSEKTFLESLKIAEKINAIPILTEVYKLIGDATDLQGKTSEAVNYYRLHTTIKNKVLKGYEKTLEYQMEQKKIDELENTKKLQSIENERKTIIIYALIGLSIALLLLSLISFSAYRNKNKRTLAEKNAQIATQNEKLAKKRIDDLLVELELKSTYSKLEGQDQERNRIAKDLHDRLGSMLATIKLYFTTIETKMASLQISDNKENYNKANTLLDEACEEVRKIAYNIQSSVLAKFGLLAELNKLAETISASKQLKVQVNAHGLDNRLENTIEVKIYRMIQELVSNVLKHADSSELTIQLNKHDKHLNIIVEDNGKGFDVQEVTQKSGMGLKNVESRIYGLGGTLNLDSSIGHGTTVSIDLTL